MQDAHPAAPISRNIHRRSSLSMSRLPVHRHPVCYIVPPHILRAIAKNGTQDQREAALDTLATDSTFRLGRATYQLVDAGAHKALAPVAAPHEQRTIYDAHHGQTLPGALVRSEGQGPSADVEVNEGYDGLGATFDLYWKV